MILADVLGWSATAVFTASYFFSKPDVLRRVQMGGAALWFGYGVVLQAPPIIVANFLVLAAAVWTTFRKKRSVNQTPPSSGDQTPHAPIR